MIGLVTRLLTWLGVIKPALARPRRNDPCPCGSGKKFKACHLDEVLADARSERERKRGARINEANEVKDKVAMAQRGLRGPNQH